MQLFSTNNKNLKADLKTAVLKSLAPDGGLYMPMQINSIDRGLIENLANTPFAEIAFQLSSTIIGDFVSNSDLKSIVNKAIDFPAPLVKLDDQRYSLELWHGPSLAFKDFGARFMAGLMSYFLQTEQQKTTILVATSGDTGGAVAAGFYNVPNIDVVILYPSGKVSDLQEKQLTTLGGNIRAIEVNGTFDDCQALVKQAFLDPNLNRQLSLASANSINIARLIPQVFYYFEAYKQLPHSDRKSVFSVPSGNFGNLTAGLIAKRMGLPIHRFIAATNANHIVPTYLESGRYAPAPSIATISNAMDVGNPSNWVRIQELYAHDRAKLVNDISGFWLNDEETRLTMQQAYDKHGYICDPHGAIGYASLNNLRDDEVGVFLETAHPAKFLDVMESTLPGKVVIPEALQALYSKEKKASCLENIDFERFSSLLLNVLG